MTQQKNDDKAKGPTKYDKPGHTKGDIDDDDKSNTLDPKELRDAGNAGAESKNREADRKQMDKNAPSREPLKPGEHLPGADFRSRVENTAAGDLNWDPREPYPVGDPPDPREEFHRIHGYYKDDEAEQQPNQKRKP